eukprot:g13237.t1
MPGDRCLGVSLMQCARASWCPWSAGTCCLAAQNGHLEVLQWCRSNGCEWNKDASKLAALEGHLEVVKVVEVERVSVDQ